MPTDLSPSDYFRSGLQSYELGHLQMELLLAWLLEQRHALTSWRKNDILVLSHSRNKESVIVINECAANKLEQHTPIPRGCLHRSLLHTCCRK